MAEQTRNNMQLSNFRRARNHVGIFRSGLNEDGERETD